MYICIRVYIYIYYCMRERESECVYNNVYEREIYRERKREEGGSKTKHMKINKLDECRQTQ